jgi:phage-related protein
MIRIWKDNTELDLAVYGLKGLRLIIPSPSYNVTRDDIPGRSGMVTLGRDLEARELTAEFLVRAADYSDSLLLRDELYSLFSAGNTFYIGEERQPGKRWLVECTEQWTPERVNPRTMTMEIPLICNSGLAESIGTTQDPFTFDADHWQFGQGLTANELIYTHTGTMFNIYNAGVKIDPRYMELAIEYKGASNGLNIKNETTCDSWAYNDTSNTGDTIKLDGVRSEKNGLTILRDTNKKLITLEPGWNGFRLSGTTGSFEIKFQFRFYYL